MPARILVVVLALISSSFSQVLTERPQASSTAAPAAAAAMQPNSHPAYQALRNVGFSGEMANVTNLVLKRDTGTFTLSGTFYFLQPVEGKVTGGVFLGNGTLNVVPPTNLEKKMIAILTKEPQMTETFNKAVFRFTDGSYEEIKKAGGTSQGSAEPAVPFFNEIKNALRKRLQYNITGRVLQDVMSEQPGGLFVAFIAGQKYNDKMIFSVDPYGSPQVAPEEVMLMTWDDNKYGVWTAFHYGHEYASGKATGTQANALIDIQHQVLDASFEKSGKLSGDARTTFAAQSGPVRVVEFSLFPKLRVSNVTDETGAALHFVQEDKDEDAQFFVILPRILAKGEKVTIRTQYSGVDAVLNEGGGNYFPVARFNWYPNTSFGDYATYELIYRLPKGLTTVGTGTRVREYTEGEHNITEWKSDAPQAVAGFNFGQFSIKEKKVKVGDKEYELYSYANKAEPEFISKLKTMAGGISTIESGGSGVGGGSLMDTQGPAIGNLSTVELMGKALGEAEISVNIFTDYFGKLPYSRISMTQQPAGNFGQAWPTLVYMPITAYIDDSARRALGMVDTRNFFKSVGSHEVAHQWWGHAVGSLQCYRDQWMSEGFAHMSASLFMQAVYKDELFRKFWQDQRELLLEKNREGFRPIDVGPVTLGYRLLNSKTGFDIPQRLIYPKGGYILHMLRMMMWDNKTRDDKFKAMMRDFVATHLNRGSSTEDFKAIVEKHMTPEMDIAGNRRMDWFFNQYVYGTDLPDYRFEHNFTKDADGSPVLWFKVTQSNVGPNFMMRVPVYLEVGKGQVMRLGAADLIGNSHFETQIPLKGLKDKPRRAMINHYYDVLSTYDGGKFN